MALITLLQAQLAYGHVALLDHTDFALETSERIGLIGRNGAGKSSLLKILAGLEKVDDGTLQLQQGLRIAYVAQEPVLDPQATVFVAASAGLAKAIAAREQYLAAEEGVDLDALQSVIEALDAWNWEQRVDETLQRLHLNGEALIGSLSGGTKKRVALAQALVAKPDVLLLDEPTNDLDIPTLEILEDNLLDFPGALVLVTHDRYLLNRVSSTVLGLDGNGHIGRFADYAQWEDWLKELEKAAQARPEPKTNSANLANSANSAKKKLSYLEAREFATIEKRVEKSDTRLAAARASVENPEIATDAAALQKALKELDAAQQESDTLYARWAELTEKAG